MSRGGTSYEADGRTVRPLRSSDRGNRDSVEGKAMREVGFFWIVVLGSLPALTGAASAATGTVPGMIGIQLASQDGWLTIQSVAANMPAARAGLRAGDRIAKIDGAG